MKKLILSMVFVFGLSFFNQANAINAIDNNDYLSTELIAGDCLDIAWEQSLLLSAATGIDQSTLFHVLVNICWDVEFADE
jgi:hypothetical protein